MGPVDDSVTTDTKSQRHKVTLTTKFCCSMVASKGVEGQPWVPVGSTVGPRLLGRHPWVPTQKSSTVGPSDQFSLLRALGNQTKLSTFDTVAFRVRRRPDRLHARRHAPPLHSPCQKFGNTDYFFKLPIKATMRGSMKLWEAAQ
jgi:hypothetical protein